MGKDGETVGWPFQVACASSGDGLNPVNHWSLDIHINRSADIAVGAITID